MVRFSSAMAATLLIVGCGSAGEKEKSAETDKNVVVLAPGIRRRSNTDPSTATPQRLLAADEVRVALLVLPGDAIVEVDKVPVRRRNGMVELAGRVGDEHRVEVFLGATSRVERTVKIEAAGTSPQLINANEDNTANVGPAKAPVVFDVNE